MNVYDANTGELLESPDLEAGYLVEGERITGYEMEVMDGTVTEERPEGLRQEVPVTEPCQWYYRNVTESVGQDTDNVTWDELAAAYNEGVTDSGQ